MKLSEAIREGSKKRPKATSAFFARDESGQMCSCAMGAAYEAVTGSSNMYDCPIIYVLEDHFPVRNSVAHPLNGEPCPVDVAVYSLNDDAGWTREQIADWLESEGL